MGRCAKDKYISEHSIILINLLCTDVILVERGFDIEESAAFYRAKVKVPVFSTCKTQLAEIDVESRRTAAVRIYSHSFYKYI